MARPFSLLFVDDEADLRELIVEACESMDVHIIAVADAHSAVETFRTRHFDAVFLDIHLPRSSGLDLLRELRAIRADFPAILWSGFWEPSVEDQAKSLGRVQLIDKPFQLRKFKELVMRLREEVRRGGENVVHTED